MNTVLALALLALSGTAYGENETALVYDYVNCALRAASVGIEGLIPPHNPLHIRDANFDQTILGVKYHFEVSNSILYNLMDLELKQVDVTTYTTPAALNIDYDIYWKVLNLTSNFAWSAEVFGVKTGGNGNINIILHHTDFTGIFHLIKPGQEAQGIKEQVDDFTLNVKVKEVEVHSHGAGPEWLADNVLELTLHQFLNHVPSALADGIKEQRFNGFWIAHPEKIRQVTQWCIDFPEA